MNGSTGGAGMDKETKFELVTLYSGGQIVKQWAVDSGSCEYSEDPRDSVPRGWITFTHAGKKVFVCGTVTIEEINDKLFNALGEDLRK